MFTMLRYIFPLFAAITLPATPYLAGADELSGTQPNIILVITDDQGHGPVGAHSHPWIRTPHLDTLHATSTRFDRFLVSPTCAPTRAALMTGRHPMKNGVTHTIFERERLTLDAVTLPEVLQSAGYTTGIFGKWHLGDEEPYQPHNRGFDEAFIHGAGGIGQAYKGSCADVPDNTYFDPVVRHNDTFVQTKGFCTDVFFEAGLGWIRSVKDSGAPFFAYITTNAPHSPFIAPEKNRERFEKLGFGEDKAGFYGMIENIDENVGLLLDKLAEWNLFEDTVVIFMSDNGMTARGGGTPGEVLGSTEDGDDLLSYNAGMKGLKGAIHEGGVRVPLFVRWDGRIEAGRDIEAVTAHIDILPTFAELAGIPLGGSESAYPAEQVEGRSLLPLIENPDAAWPDRHLFTHRGRWEIGAEPNEHQWEDYAVRNHRFRLVEDALYDMENDPGQTADVSADHPEVVDEMKAAYDEFWREARPLMVNEGVPLSPTRPYHVLYEKQKSETGIPEWSSPDL